MTLDQPAPATPRDRRATLFGRVYVWVRGPRGWQARIESPLERDARLAVLELELAAAREQAARFGDTPAARATLARLDDLERAGRG